MRGRGKTHWVLQIQLWIHVSPMKTKDANLDASNASLHSKDGKKTWCWFCAVPLNACVFWCWSGGASNNVYLCFIQTERDRVNAKPRPTELSHLEDVLNFLHRESKYPHRILRTSRDYKFWSTHTSECAIAHMTACRTAGANARRDACVCT